MKTIAQQLNIKTFPFIIKDDNGNQIYSEYSKGFWKKRTYDDDNGNFLIYFEDSDGYWEKRTFDDNGDVIYFEDSDGDTWGTKPKSKALLKVEEAEKALASAKAELEREN